MRTVSACHAAYRDDIADLITRRPVPSPDVPQVDPFLFLNHHGPQVYPPNNAGLPFGPHPHRGFETVTFILAGSLAHRDSGGHESIINAGGVQWMTAGSGLVHSELSPEDFKRQGGAMEILQLWVNLPARLKMTSPRYIGLQRDDIPCVPLASGQGEMRLISGVYAGVTGPIPSLTGVFMSVVQLQPGTEVVLPAPQGNNVFLYVVCGSVNIADTPVSPWNLVEMHDDGDAVVINATEKTVLLFGYAEPIEEPVVSYGPFVMNTRDEIQQAIADYHAGKFDKV